MSRNERTLGTTKSEGTAVNRTDAIAGVLTVCIRLQLSHAKTLAELADRLLLILALAYILPMGLKDESLEDADELPEPEELATDAIGELEEVVGELNAVLTVLENANSPTTASESRAV